MLYHVPDSTAASPKLARVLRPGRPPRRDDERRSVTCRSSGDAVRLRRLAAARFSVESGEEHLRRHFAASSGATPRVTRSSIPDEARSRTPDLGRYRDLAGMLPSIRCARSRHADSRHLRRGDSEPAIPELIQRKRDGGELTAAEIDELILGDVPDYQLAAFCMAVFFRGMTARRDVRAHRRDGAERRADRPARGDRPARRRQALDRRRGGQGDARSRARRRGVRRALREDERPRPRAYGRHARQARVDPRLPHRADDGRVHRAGEGDRHRRRRPERRPRPGGQEALRAARRDGDRRQPAAHRGEHHVEEDRLGRRRDRPRREGRRRRVHEVARRARVRSRRR